MIQKKYMWGLVLGLLGVTILIQDASAASMRFRTSKKADVTQSIGTQSWFNMPEEEWNKLITQWKSEGLLQNLIATRNRLAMIIDDIDSYSYDDTKKDILKKRKAIIDNLLFSQQQDQQQMSQSPANLYRSFKENFYSNWALFSQEYKQILEEMQINSLEDLKRQANIQGGQENQGNQGEEGNQNLGGQGNQDLGGGEDVNKDDQSGFGGFGEGGQGDEAKLKGKEEDKSSGVVAHEEIAAAIQALLKLSEKLTLSVAITNQDQWKAFCNAFAALIERDAWDQSKAYEWDGTNLK